ncbi:MAG TPA: hypothetical protein VK724_12570 [Bryobacteraceae bacterium]|nr:hypothetical protein [Bryobacteraceae bacterium]
MNASPMGCLYCRKKIGPLRKLSDRHFCCNDHRKRFGSKSARVIRETEDLYGVDDASVPTWRAVTAPKAEDKHERKAGMGATLFFGAAIAVLLLAVSQMPMNSPAAKAISPLPNNPHNTRGGFGQAISNLIQSQTSGTLREDFHSGFSNWDGLKSASSEWAMQDGVVRPTSLRLWKPSTSLSNYELEFQGQINHKSMDWAFRAADLHNYYATKLVITHPGPLPNAGLVRFIVLDGRERERVELPLPLTLDPGVDYRVRVSVRGDRFLTSVNGQLISSWMDNRISRGGVGFFSEDGESALLKWVSVSERDSFLARLTSHFSLITVPTAALANVQ